MSTFFFQENQKLVQSGNTADNLHDLVWLYALPQVTKETLALISDELDNCFELITVGESFNSLDNSWFR